MKFDLNELLAFERVASLKSFTHAATFLQQPKGTISRKIKSLENRLGIRLLDRTTRSLRLTEAGELYYYHCNKMFTSLNKNSKDENTPTQPLKVCVHPNTVISSYETLLAKFNKKYPFTCITFYDTTTYEASPENIDLLFSSNLEAPTGWNAIEVTTNKNILCCTPYFLENKMFNNKDKISSANTLLADNKEIKQLPHSINLTSQSQFLCSNANLRLEMCLNHFGISILPETLVHQHVENGQLIEVLRGIQLKNDTASIAYRNNNGIPKRVKQFLEIIS